MAVALPPVLCVLFLAWRSVWFAQGRTGRFDGRSEIDVRRSRRLRIFHESTAGEFPQGLRGVADAKQNERVKIPHGSKIVVLKWRSDCARGGTVQHVIGTGGVPRTSRVIERSACVATRAGSM